MESDKQTNNNSSRTGKEAPASLKPEQPTEINLEEEPAIARREEEEEAETDADADYDDEIESEFEDIVNLDAPEYLPSDRKRPRESLRYRSLTPEPPTYRKRSHDEASDDADSEVGLENVPAREGTPPKRVRLGEVQPENPLSLMIESPPLRQRKRSSEELEDDAHKAGTQSPKRLRA